MTPYEQSQLRAFVEIDVAIRWQSRGSLVEQLDAYLYTHLCHTLGQNEAESLYDLCDQDWEPEISIGGNCFVVELVLPKEE